MYTLIRGFGSKTVKAMFTRDQTGIIPNQNRLDLLLFTWNNLEPLLSGFPDGPMQTPGLHWLFLEQGCYRSRTGPAKQKAQCLICLDPFWTSSRTEIPWSFHAHRKPIQCWFSIWIQFYIRFELICVNIAQKTQNCAGLKQQCNLAIRLWAWSFYIWLLMIGRVEGRGVN